MDNEDYEEWIAAARRRTQQHMEEARKQFGLGTYARYEIDLSSATIRFLDASGTARVQADLQVAGSWSPVSLSWMWSWDNGSLPTSVHSRMTTVRQFGVTHQLPLLQSAVQPCDEGLAWSMASVSDLLLEADCVYRVPAKSGMLFLLMFGLRRLS